jgi:hypothetical protein
MAGLQHDRDLDDWPRLYSMVAADTQLTPRKPVIMGEGAYENGPEYPKGPITPLLVRRQAWWTCMAGGFHTYGQDRMWRMGKGWTRTLDTPGAAQVCRMKDIMTSFKWWELVPDQSVFTEGGNSGRTLNTAMRSIRNDLVMIYLADQSTVFVHLDKIIAKKVKATWYHTVKDETRDAGTFETGHFLRPVWPMPKQQHFTTPGHWEDAVLVLEAVK